MNTGRKHFTEVQQLSRGVYNSEPLVAIRRVFDRKVPFGLVERQTFRRRMRYKCSINGREAIVKMFERN